MAVGRDGFNHFKKAMAYINMAAGGLLIIIGIMIITDSMNLISEKALSLFAK